LPELCELALLWAIANKRDAANSLATWLFPFIQEVEMRFLWCLEENNNEEEGLFSFSLLLRAFGLREKSDQLLQRMRSPIDLFYVALARENVHFDLPSIDVRELDDSSLGIKLFRKKRLTAAFTFAGERTSLGVVCSKDVQIRAMGPQGLPLSDPYKFGIYNPPNSSSWTRCFAFPEVWFEMKHSINEDECFMDLRFFGLEAEKPLAFVFYIKAQSCSVGQLILKPQSLQRYLGEGACYLFQGGESALKIQAGVLQKTQVIPLAGEGSFWNSDFLLAFEMRPFGPLGEARAEFKITVS
jgi:hypothetical protein